MTAIANRNRLRLKCVVSIQVSIDSGMPFYALFRRALYFLSLSKKKGKQKMKKRISILLAAVVILSAVFALISCNNTAGEDDSIWANATYTEDTALGSGSTEFILNVEADGKTVAFTVRTDKAVLGDALLELGLIEGEDSSYGLYVKKVNGILADYDVDKHYWSLWIGDNYAPSGVDSTQIEAGVTYKLERAK